MPVTRCDVTSVFPSFFQGTRKLGFFFLKCKFNSFCYFVGNFLRTFQYHKIEGEKTPNITLLNFINKSTNPKRKWKYKRRGAKSKLICYKSYGEV